jgi:C_GCAxxG_C_C family probable redox protein
MTKKEKQKYALKKFADNLNCAQSVLAAYCDEVNLPLETAEKAGSAFGAGMGEGEICGAVSGGLMVLGLKYGKSDISMLEKEKTKAIFEHFKREFEEMHGNLKCKKLIKYDLRKADEYQKANEHGVFRTACPGFIETAINLIEKNRPEYQK